MNILRKLQLWFVGSFEGATSNTFRCGTPILQSGGTLRVRTGDLETTICGDDGSVSRGNHTARVMRVGQSMFIDPPGRYSSPDELRAFLIELGELPDCPEVSAAHDDVVELLASLESRG